MDTLAQLTSASVAALQEIAPSVPLPQPPTPDVPTVPLPVPQTPIAASSLSTITGHISQANQVAQQVAGAMRVAGDLRAATDGLRDGTLKASDFARQGLHGEAKVVFDGAPSAAKSVVSGLFHLIPLPGSPETHRTKHVTKTRWKTKTNMHTVSATREVEKTN